MSSIAQNSWQLPLGAADGAIKNAILGDNGLRVFGYRTRSALTRPDRLADAKALYERAGPSRTNLRYGYIHKPV